MYLAAWWTTDVARTAGISSEILGVFVLGPLLSFNNVVLIPEQSKPFIWHGVSGKQK